MGNGSLNRIPGCPTMTEKCEHKWYWLGRVHYKDPEPKGLPWMCARCGLRKTEDDE